MSIYISGLEFPKVPTFIILLPDGQVEIPSQARMAKAMPVPEHGDLIDKQYAYQNTMTLGEHTRKIVLKQIDALPVVIPADPVKEGDG